MSWVGLACRLVVGGVFVYASLGKLADPAGFAMAVSHYRLVPLPILHVFASLLPVVEMVAGASLVLGFRTRGAALVAGAMTLVFSAAIAAALARNLDISCGCFHTDGGHAVGLSLLWRDALLLAACVPPLVLRDSGPAVDGLFRRTSKK